MITCSRNLSSDNITLSITLSESDKQIEYIKYTVYSIAGTLLILLNLPIVASVLRHQLLRIKKEYVMVAGRASVDMFFGIANVCIGATRIYKLREGEYQKLISMSECAKDIPLNLILLATTAQAFMFLAMSSDRLICVSFPRKYITLTRFYSMLLLLFACLISVVFYGFIFFPLLGETQASVSAACILSDVLHADYFTIFHGTRLGASICSVLLYILVLVIFKRRASMVIFPKTFNKVNEQQEILQRKLTLTVGIGSVLTFIFYITPNCLSIYFKSDFVCAGFLNSFLWPCISINAMLVVFLYAYRHREIRLAIRYLLTRKDLKPNMIF